MSCNQFSTYRNLGNLSKVCLISAAMIPFALTPIHSAFAVNGSVKKACKSDYFAFCSSHSLGSKGLRNCMRTAGRKLSKSCVNALVASGEVTKKDLARYAKRSR